MTDDDIRAMLQAKAAEATVSPDAFDQIQARLTERSAARPKRVLAGVASGAVAAAVVAGLVLSQNGPTSQTADDPTTSITTGTTTPMATNQAIDEAVSEWLQPRVPMGVKVGERHIEMGSDGGTATVRFTGGFLATELHLVPLSSRPGWAVAAATSDLLRFVTPTYDGNELVGEVVAEVAGEVTISYFPDNTTEPVPGGVRQLAAREQTPLHHPEAGLDVVAVRVVLVTADGQVAIAEQQAEPISDPANVQGSHVAVWPAVDAVGLASFQAQANQGRRDDLLDPQAVAGGFLSERLPRDESPTSFQIGDFQRGDANSGEVPYTLSDGSEGVILVRTTNEGDTPIWYVVGATSDTLSFVTAPYREGSNLQADVESTKAGTLRWVGATDIEVGAGQKVTIGRPDTPLGSYPVVVQLMDGDRTLAIVARLG